MKIGPLAVLNRIHCNGEPTRSILIAGWHWPRSITWRWALDWTPYVKGPTLFRWPDHPTEGSAFAGVRIPLLGCVTLWMQPNMAKRA
jgi:hypothetical protein